MCCLFRAQQRKKFSMRQISQHFGIRRQNFKNLLWRYINGYVISDETKLNYLNEVEEDLLKQIIISKRNENKSMTKDEVIKQAYIIKKNRIKETSEIYNKYFPKDIIDTVDLPSMGWLDCYNQRNNLIKKKEEILEVERHINGTSGTIKDYFNILEKEFPDIKEYNPKLIGNFDETMFELRNKKEVCVVEKNKRAIKESQDLKEHISVVCSYTASGKF